MSFAHHSFDHPPRRKSGPVPINNQVTNSPWKKENPTNRLQENPRVEKLPLPILY